LLYLSVCSPAEKLPEAVACSILTSLWGMAHVLTLYVDDINLYQASFHVLLNKDDFPLINNNGVWHNCSLFGQLNLEQIILRKILSF
jgi:hypothetical protein